MFKKVAFSLALATIIVQLHAQVPSKFIVYGNVSEVYLSDSLETKKEDIPIVLFHNGEEIAQMESKMFGRYKFKAECKGTYTLQFGNEKYQQKIVVLDFNGAEVSANKLRVPIDISLFRAELYPMEFLNETPIAIGTYDASEYCMKYDADHAAKVQNQMREAIDKLKRQRTAHNHQ